MVTSYEVIVSTLIEFHYLFVRLAVLHLGKIYLRNIRTIFKISPNVSNPLQIG